MVDNFVGKTHSIAISVKCDKVVYPSGATVYIRARLNSIISGELIIIEVYNSENKLLVMKKIHPSKFNIRELKAIGIYQTSFRMKGKEWKIKEKYTIKAKHGNAEAYDSFFVDRRNPVVQTDKTVYMPDSDIILTVVDPDANLDSQKTETLGIKRNQKVTISTSKDKITNYKLIETGRDTGIFQGVIHLKPYKKDDKLRLKRPGGNGPFDGIVRGTRGEQITFTYENGYATASVLGYVSNFGATVEMDQRVYTWTDKVVIVVVAPDYNLNPNGVDRIKVNIKTKNASLPDYTLVETGPNTGIFTGSIILTGNPKIKGSKGVDEKGTNPSGKSGGSGPVDGFLPCNPNDVISVSFEYAEGQHVTGSSIIRWNIGAIKWLQPSYRIGDTAVIQVIDPDMNLDPQSIDKFDVKVWSNSDPDGITISVVETGMSTGIFQGFVNLVVESDSENKLKVKDGDKIFAQYIDRTLPSPYTTSNEVILKSIAFVGKIIPPLTRLALTEPIIVDQNNNKLQNIKTGQLAFMGAKVTNIQECSQSFVFMMQIKDESGTVVHLSYMPYSILVEQSVKPLLPWRAETAGEFHVQIFTREVYDEPIPLSSPLEFKIRVESSQETRDSTIIPRPSLSHDVKICLGSSRPDNLQFFVPDLFTVKKGDKVTWINEDKVGHTVISGKPSDSQAGAVFDSSLISPGKRYTCECTEIGTFYYFCLIHPWEIGIINVE